MSTCATDNRQVAEERQNTNLDMLLSERHKFLGDGIRVGDKVLEIGAGIGITHRYLPQVDLCQTDVEANPWINVVTSGETLPFTNETFDVVICIAALHHMDHPLKALHEMARVLRPSGKAFIMEPHASLLLRLLLRITKHEYVDKSVDPFGPYSCQSRKGGNWDGNNAIGDLLFADMIQLGNEIPQLSCVHHRYTETLLFMNSGGVNFKAPYIPLPQVILKWMAGLDKIFARRAPDVLSLSQEIILQKNVRPRG